MSSFTAATIDNDPDLLEVEVDESLEAKFEGWSPAEAGLATWMKKTFVRITSTIRQQAAETQAAMFKRFGQTIAKVPPILAASASANSTWSMIDNAGYTIPDGTLVAIAASGDVQVGFRTVGDVVVAPGSTTTAAGEVLLQAVEAGVSGNELTADPTLIDALAFVDSIALVGETSGGVDEEDEDTYLNRLTQRMQLLSLSLIVPRDFEIDAIDWPGVARAVCLPGYNPLDDTLGNGLMFTVFVASDSGGTLSSGVKEELQEAQEERIPDGTINHVADGSYTEIDAAVTFHSLPGYDPVVIAAAVKARLTEYFSPANWGIPFFGEAPGGWINQPTVYINEVISIADQVAGVERVVTATIAKKGNTKKAEDLALSGRVPLTKAATITAAAA